MSLLAACISKPEYWQQVSATMIGSIVAGAVIGQGTCLLLVMAIMSNLVESATLAFRQTTDVLTFGIYCSMETYDETVISLTQKRD